MGSLSDWDDHIPLNMRKGTKKLVKSTCQAMKQQSDAVVPGWQLKARKAVEVLKEPAVVLALKEQMVLPSSFQPRFLFWLAEFA